MKRILIIFALIVITFMSTSCGVSFSQEELEADFTYGTVIEKSQDIIKLSEYNPEKDASEVNSYYITSDVALDNIDSLEEIKEKDEIEIEYDEYRGKRTITYIHVYKR